MLFIFLPAAQEYGQMLPQACSRTVEAKATSRRSNFLGFSSDPLPLKGEYFDCHTTGGLAWIRRVQLTGLGKRISLLAFLCISGFREQVPMDAGTLGPTDGDNL